MNPQQKTEILRMYEKNPALAFVMGFEILRTEMKEMIAKEKKGEKGDAGAMADSDKIKSEILAYMKSYMPKDGKSPTNNEVLAIVRPLIPKVKDGKTPTRGELLAIMKPLIAAMTDPNKIWPESKLIALMKPLMPLIVPETAEGIARKLNTLAGVIDQSVIKGLDKSFEGMRKAINVAGRERSAGKSPAGGGMGNVKHESFSVGSSTISVTLASRIAANGFAIWAYHQGQLIVRGTHYTVGADHKNLPLTFTPQDSTTIDVIYIRT